MATKKRCPTCGEELDPGWSFCPRCQNTSPVGQDYPGANYPSSPGTMQMPGYPPGAAPYPSYPESNPSGDGPTLPYGGGGGGGGGGGYGPPGEIGGGETVIIRGASVGLCMAWLVITSRHGRNRRFDLKEGRNRIGRSTDNDIILDDETTSREHALVTKKEKEDDFIILDLMSTAGTIINNKSIEGPTVLKDGDLLVIGETELIFKQIKTGPKAAGGASS